MTQTVAPSSAEDVELEAEPASGWQWQTQSVGAGEAPELVLSLPIGTHVIEAVAESTAARPGLPSPPPFSPPRPPRPPRPPVLLVLLSRAWRLHPPSFPPPTARPPAAARFNSELNPPPPVLLQGCERCDGDGERAQPGQGRSEAEGKGRVVLLSTKAFAVCCPQVNVRPEGGGSSDT